jgi:hypothetical protein
LYAASDDDKSIISELMNVLNDTPVETRKKELQLQSFASGLIRDKHFEIKRTEFLPQRQISRSHALMHGYVSPSVSLQVL